MSRDANGKIIFMRENICVSPPFAALLGDDDVPHCLIYFYFANLEDAGRRRQSDMVECLHTRIGFALKFEHRVHENFANFSRTT